MIDYSWPEGARNDNAFVYRIVYNSDDVPVLEQTILNATYMMQHTPDIEAKLKYKSIVRKAAEGYYVATGDWYHTSSLQKTIVGGRE